MTVGDLVYYQTKSALPLAPHIGVVVRDIDEVYSKVFFSYKGRYISSNPYTMERGLLTRIGHVSDFGLEV